HSRILRLQQLAKRNRDLRILRAIRNRYRQVTERPGNGLKIARQMIVCKKLQDRLDGRMSLFRVHIFLLWLGFFVQPAMRTNRPPIFVVIETAAVVASHSHRVPSTRVPVNSGASTSAARDA